MLASDRAGLLGAGWTSSCAIVTDDPHHNQPISEQFRVVAKQWVDADEAASLLEETKTSILSDMIGRVLSYNIGMPYNKAELSAKSSPEYKEFITEMVQLRSKANLLKVKLEYIRMRFSEQQSHEATARAERRL